MDEATAEDIAARAFGFLAEDRVRITRFLSLTGIGPEALPALAGERAFLAGVLDHLMGDDALILTFCANAGIEPRDVLRAHRALTGRGGETP